MVAPVSGRLTTVAAITREIFPPFKILDQGGRAMKTLCKYLLLGSCPCCPLATQVQAQEAGNEVDCYPALGGTT
jgi:hypothetical protein